MHPTASKSAARPADSRAGYARHSQAVWDLARRDYVAGDSGTQVCDRYGLRPSTFTDRARREGWRKSDQPDPPPVPDDDLEGDAPVDCAALARDALGRVRQALRKGRAAEAASWMRLHEKLLARIEAGVTRERRRERVEQTQGSAGARDPLVNALRPLRERMAFINGLGAAQVRVGRAWRHGYISTMVYERLNGLNSAAVGALDQLLATPAADLAAGGDSDNSRSVFSVAPDP